MGKELVFTAAWNDGVALLKAHREAAIAIAGVFVFLPQLIFSYLYPAPVIEGSDTNSVIEQFKAYYDTAAFGILLTSVLSGVGVLAINFLSINRLQPATGDAIVLGAKHYLTMLAASILSGIAIGIGLILLIVPGIYLLIKLSQVRTVIAAENQLNPIEAMSRSWQITKGNSLRIFGFILIIAVVGTVAMLLFNMVLGGAASFILSGNAGLFAAALVSTFSGALFTLLFEFVNMGIYRQLVSQAE